MTNFLLARRGHQGGKQVFRYRYTPTGSQTRRARERPNTTPRATHWLRGPTRTASPPIPPDGVGLHKSPRIFNPRRWALVCALVSGTHRDIQKGASCFGVYCRSPRWQCCTFALNVWMLQPSHAKSVHIGAPRAPPTSNGALPFRRIQAITLDIPNHLPLDPNACLVWALSISQACPRPVALRSLPPLTVEKMGSSLWTGFNRWTTETELGVIIHFHMFQLSLDIKVVRAIRPTNSYRIDGEGADTALLRNRQTRTATYQEKLVRTHHFKPHHVLGEASINNISSFGRR
jgi:hypothetical protein